MDMSYLAELMLKWEKAKQYADELEVAIRDAVLDLGKTQTVGNVRATYSAGRKAYDYEGAARGHRFVTAGQVELFSKTSVTVDWRGICGHVGIEDIPYTQSEPSVTVKLLA